MQAKKPIEIKLPVHEIAAEALKYPEVIDTIKVNLQLRRQGNIVAIPKHIGDHQLLPIEYFDLLKEIGVIVNEDKHVFQVDFQRLEEIHKDEQGIRRLIEQVAAHYGIDVKTLMNQLESIRLLLGIGE
ncbi:MAG: hypothetical protein [aquatic viral metagenome]